MYTLNKAALLSIDAAMIKGIAIDDTPRGIVELILEQEIITYCNEKGCVSFDTSDLDFNE